jgi:RNA polymerase sigma-70 factor (ECF subfamily)
VGYALQHADQAEVKQELEIKNVTLDIMHAALQTLEEKQRNCIVAFYLEKKNYQKIMQEQQLDYMKVKSYIQNGKRNLKIAIEKKLQELHK